MQIMNHVVQQLQAQSNAALQKFNEKRGNPSIQIQLDPISRRGVDIVYDLINSPQLAEHKKKFSNPDNLDVIVGSSGGDADAAYHIAKMLDRHCSGELSYIIPRYAKSAATLLCCGGDKIVMSETSELGPLDPQIRQDDGSYISAKAVQSTLELMKKHLGDSKNKTGIELATILATRINPLVLGQYDSTMSIAKEYQKELLALRMFDEKGKKQLAGIVNRFAEGYTHHSRVIGCNEAKEIFGDKVELLDSRSEEWQYLWQFYTLSRDMQELVGAMKIVENEMQKR